MEAKLDTTDSDGVPASSLKHGVVGVQEIYSPGQASNSGDVTGSDRKGRL